MAEKPGWYWVWLETPLVLTAPASVHPLYQNESIGTTRVDIKPALSEQVKEKRKELGLSQEEAAQALGFSQSYYSKLERNQVELSPDCLQKVERWLDEMPDTQA